MSTTKKILVLNSLMIFMMIFCSFVAAIKIESTNQKTSINESQPGSGAGNAAATASVVNECISAFMEAMPPAFCWKKGGDAGVIPTLCPNGYFRSLALCFQHCREGFTHILGICYKNCDGGMTNLGLSCWRTFPFRFYFKESYIPHSLTNFDSQIPCPGNMYKSGALCYRNCEAIGMKNCGIGACVSPGASCGMQIMEMTLKVFEGIATGVSTIMSFGATSAASSTARATIKASTSRLSTQMLAASRATISSLKTSSPAVKERFFAKAKAAMLNNLKGAVETHPYKVLADSLCKATWMALIDENKPSQNLDSPDKVEDSFFKSIDVLGAIKIKESCKDVGNSDKATNCSKAIVESVATFDPTGLLTIASAFIHPVCEVPYLAPEVIYYDYEREALLLKQRTEEYLKLLDDYSPKCIFVWTQINFLGQREEICENNATLGLIDNKIASFMVGKNAEGFFFRDDLYNGPYIYFKPSTVEKNVSNLVTATGINLANSISSIVLEKVAIVSLHYYSIEIQKNYLITESNYIMNFRSCNVNKATTKFISVFYDDLVICSFQKGSYIMYTSFSKRTEPNDNDWPGERLLECKLQVFIS